MIRDVDAGERRRFGPVVADMEFNVSHLVEAFRNLGFPDDPVPVIKSGEREYALFIADNRFNDFAGRFPEVSVLMYRSRFRWLTNVAAGSALFRKSSSTVKRYSVLHSR